VIKLTDINGRVVYLAPSAIAQVTEAGVSQAWHGVRANVKMFDGGWIEVQQTPDVINAQITDAT
jgi:hypothetical protein